MRNNHPYRRRITFRSWGEPHRMPTHALSRSDKTDQWCVARAIAKKTFGLGGRFNCLQVSTTQNGYVALVGDRDFTKPIKVFFALDAA